MASIQKLSGLYYNALQDVMVQKGERLQLVMPPVQVKSATSEQMSDYTLAASMDQTPLFALLPSDPELPPSPFVEKGKGKKPGIADPTLPFAFSNYSAMFSDVNLPVGNYKKLLGPYWRAWTDYNKNLAKERNFAPDSREALDDFLYSDLFKGDNAEDILDAFDQLKFNPIRAAADSIATFKLEVKAGNLGFDGFYSLSYQDLLTNLANGGALNSGFNSGTSNSNVNNTWADGAIGGAYNFFTASADTDYERLSTIMNNSKMTLEWSCDHFLVIDVYAQRGQWYNEAFVNLTKSPSSGPKQFQNGQEDYDKYYLNDKKCKKFGSLTWALDSIIVASGIKVKILAETTFTSEEKTKVEQHAKAGFWPFFSGRAGYKNECTIKSGEEQWATIEMKTPSDVPLVIGHKVRNIIDD